MGQTYTLKNIIKNHFNYLHSNNMLIFDVIITSFQPFSPPAFSRCLSIRVTLKDRQTPEEGWRVKRPKLCDNNIKDEDVSSNVEDVNNDDSLTC